jgi:hypothetical protein
MAAYFIGIMVGDPKLDLRMQVSFINVLDPLMVVDVKHDMRRVAPWLHITVQLDDNTTVLEGDLGRIRLFRATFLPRTVQDGERDSQEILADLCKRFGGRCDGGKGFFVSTQGLSAEQHEQLAGGTLEGTHIYLYRMRSDSARSGIEHVKSLSPTGNNQKGAKQ